MSEPRKTLTLYFVSSDEKKTRRITFPVAYFKVTLFIVAILVLGFLAGFIDYFGLLAQSLENKKITAAKNIKQEVRADFSYNKHNFY